ncbi:MAG TPA: HAMP domain-containing sensor histidine kinase [Gaiellaceae bacterium]|nr:HAMP domain-containing sensor histidine kinase [Gaiellaceae bacterium]
MAERAAIRPGRLRRRLTIAFLLVAGLSAAALAVASYAIVREARLSDSVDRSLEQSRFNLVLANETLSADPSSQEIDQLLAAYERRGGFETVGTTGSQRFSSSVSLGIQEVPPDLRALVRSGKLGYQRAEVGNTRYLIVGGKVRRADAELYYFYSEERLWDELAQLRNVLLAALAVVAVLGALVGAALARGILAPVGRASQAAHSLAEGLLETRLPVESRDEFGTWAASFNEMAEALEAKIRALSEAQARERRFTSDVSHELRTPLTALVAEASLLGEQLDRMPAEARRPAELLVNDVARLRDLVEDLMEISRLDAGEARVQEERVDLDSLVRAAVRSRAWEDRVRVDGNEVVLRSDHRRLERIASNLIGNALEHGGRDVSARIGRDGVGIFLEVSDHGAGIPPDRLPHVFDRFYKADTARAGPGSGLGLAIALENARLLGGDIEVWSEVGRGTRFTLRLPA